jgi:hypothetical protein
METMELQSPEIELGTVLEFNSEAFESSKLAWKNQLVPAILQIKEEYEALDIGKFNQEIYIDILSGTDKIERRFIKEIESQIKKSKLERLFNDEYVRSEVPKRLTHLRAAKSNLARAFDSARGGIGWYKLGALKLQHDQVTIVDGNPVVNECAIRACYTKAVETEAQKIVWAKAIAFKKVWDEFRSLLIEKGFPENCGIVLSADRTDAKGTRSLDNFFAEEQPDGELYLDPMSLTMLK